MNDTNISTSKEKSRARQIGDIIGLIALLFFVIIFFGNSNNQVKQDSVVTAISSSSISQKSEAEYIDSVATLINRDLFGTTIKLSVVPTTSVLKRVVEYYIGANCNIVNNNITIMKDNKTIYTGKTKWYVAETATRALNYCVLARSEYSKSEKDIYWLPINYDPSGDDPILNGNVSNPIIDSDASINTTFTLNKKSLPVALINDLVE